MNFMKFVTALLTAFGFILMMAALCILIAFPIMWAWNYAVVAIWKLPVITWGQAWCLSFLAHILIKSSK